VSRRAERLVGAVRRLPVPEGTYAIGAGLVVVGLTAYVFQIVAAKRLSDSDYAALNVLWAIIFVVAPGLFLPLEQEVARALASRRALGIGGGPLVRRAAGLGGALALTVIVACGAASGLIVDELFNGHSGLLVGLFVAVISYYVAHIVRGTLSGNGRFGPYGLMQGAEGVVRLVFCLALAAAAVSAAGWYGLALALPPFFAVAVSLRGQHGLLLPGPPAPWSELSSALALLLLGSMFAQALSYASVLGVQILAAPDQKELVAGFITGLFIARIPLLLFQAIQAALLPKLSGFAAEGKHADFRTGMRRLLLVVGALCVGGTIAASLVGPEVGKLLFPTKWVLDHRDMALLTLAATSFILALTLAQGLIALKAYGAAATAWVCGIVGFVGTAAAGNDLFLRNELGFLVGSGVAAVLMATFLLVTMRRRTASLGDLVEAIEHEPLEL